MNHLFTYLLLLFFSSCNLANNKPIEKKSIKKDSITLNKPPVFYKKDTTKRIEFDNAVLPVTYIPIHYDSSKKYIYLTFDDGPQHGTAEVFNICNQLNIKATFFMVGLHADKKSDGHALVTAIRSNYPQILLANHSFTHANDKYKYFYHHPDMAEHDFLQAQKSLHVPFKIIRLPGNSAWVTKKDFRTTELVKPVSEKLAADGFNVIGWDVEWHFNHKTANPVQSAEKMAMLVDSLLIKNKTHTANHIVILTHDRMFRNANYTDSLAKFINLLKTNSNYVFETVDHYPNLKKTE